MPTLRERFSDSMSANARLARTARVNLDELAPGTFSLVRKFAQEVSPSGIIDGLGQHTAGQSLDVQVFDNNHTVVVDQHTAELVLEIGSLVLNMRVLPLQHGNGFPATVRPLVLAPSHPPLCDAQSALCITVQTRIANLSAVAEGCEGRQPNINPDRPAGCRKRNRIALHGEDHEPAARFALDRNRLDLAVDRAVELDLDLSHALNANQPARESTAVSIRREGQAIVATTGFETRKAGTFTTFDSTKECLECLVEAPQDVLAAGEVGDSNQTLSPHLFQLACLIVVVDRLPANPVRPYALFEGAVVEIASLAKLIIQSFDLIPMRVDLIPERLSHSVRFPDIQYTLKTQQKLRKACDSSAA